MHVEELSVERISEPIVPDNQTERDESGFNEPFAFRDHFGELMAAISVEWPTPYRKVPHINSFLI